MGDGSGVRKRVLCFAVSGVVISTLVWTATSSVALPAPEALVPNTVARISDMSKRPGTITRAELQHALVLAAAGKDQAVPRRSESEYTELSESALVGLIEAVWIKGQAAEMGISVSHEQVVRERARLKRENFATAAEFRRFLRISRLTRRDIYERVELQILAMKIQQRVLSRVKSEAEEQKVFEEFLDKFNEKWRPRTVCAPEHAVAHCSNGPNS